MKNIYFSLLFLILPITIAAQKIFIDQPLKVGNVTVFPAVDDPNQYYYFPGNPRLAKSPDGKPKFSFLLYTEKDRSDVTEQSIEDQAGGGLVHAVVEYGLTEEEVRITSELLKSKNSKGVLKGPIVFKSGNVALISAVADKSSGHTKKIIGVGKAPLLEGNKAAIAFMLDKKGAQILWSTFNTPTPDVSFSFEMEMAGYLTPIKGYIKGNYDQIYEMHDMGVEASGSLGPITFGAEIAATFDKMRQDSKLEVYIEGDDEQMDKYLEIGYKKIADAIFEPMSQSYSQLINNDPSKQKPGLDQLEGLANLQKLQTEAQEKQFNLDQLKKKAENTNTSPSSSNNSSSTPDNSSNQDSNTNDQKEETSSDEDEEAHANAHDAVDKEDASYKNTDDTVQLKLKDGREVSVKESKLWAIIDNCQQAIEFSDKSSKSKNETVTFNPKNGSYKNIAMDAKLFSDLVDICRYNKSDKVRELLNERNKKTSSGGKGGPNPSFDFYDDYFQYPLPLISVLNNATLKSGPTAPFSVHVAYRYRQTKKTGVFNINFNKVSADTRFETFVGNVGDVKEKCSSCFNVVSLDEMKHFKQREILVILDGSVLNNFKKFINGVSIQLRKDHPGGTSEYEDATLSYTNFAQDGNIRKLAYGWKNDSDDNWPKYKYKIDWDFYGGYKVTTDLEGKIEFEKDKNGWTKQHTDKNILTVTPPLSLKTVTIEADPDFIEDNAIKYVTVSVKYPFGDSHQKGYIDFDKDGQFTNENIRIRPDQNIYSKQVGIILPNNSEKYQYKYTVTTYEGERISSDYIDAKDLTIYVDQIPKQ